MYNDNMEFWDLINDAINDIILGKTDEIEIGDIDGVSEIIKRKGQDIIITLKNRL